MSKLVARSREKNAKTAQETDSPPQKPPQKGPDTPPGEPSETTEPAAPRLTDLIGNALKFTPKPAKTAAQATPAPPAAPAEAAEPAEEEAAAAPAPEPPKKKGPKKVTLPPVDTASIARDAATAATQAALQTLGRAAPKEPDDPTGDLSDQDKRDYTIAAHLATMDPRYKDAPKIILQHVKMADEYAARWETSNPGKVFDPQDDEHNEFYAQLRRPWTPEEFQDAAIDLRAEQKARKIAEQQDSKLAEVQSSLARTELAPVAGNHFSRAAVQLVSKVDEALGKSLADKGWEALNDAEPITARAITETLNQIHPFVEAVVHIDDPRIGLDIKNPVHQQWNLVVSQGEANLAGTQLPDGRMFATRAAYGRMSKAQQAQHWFLTQEMIIDGVIDYAAQQVKQIASQHTEQLQKMGYVRQPKTTPATPAARPQQAPAPQPPMDKPVSPTVGSGAKIDQPATAPQTGNGALLQQISRILGR